MRKPSNPLEELRICKHSPPLACVVPVQEFGGKVGISFHYVFPVVTDAEWCHQFAPSGPALVTN